MNPRRPDSPFGADPADFFGDYEDAWPQDVDEPVDEPAPVRGRHRREVPKGSKLERLRKAWRRG